MGDAFEPGPVDARPQVQVDQPGRDRSGSAICVVIFCLPFTPAGVPWRDEFDWKYVNYAPITVGVRAADRRHLVAGAARKHTFTGPVRNVEFDDGAGRRRGEAGAARERPVIGLCAARRAGALERTGTTRRCCSPRNYVDAGAARGRASRCCSPPDPARRRPGRVLDLSTAAADGADCLAPAAPTIGDAPERDAFELALAAARDGARPAAARRLPRDAGDERRARRHADPAPARRRRPRGPPRASRRVRRPRRAARRRLARRARRGRAACTRRSRTTTRASTRSATGFEVTRLGDGRRPAGGDRGSGAALRARRAVAPGGRRALADDRRAGRRRRATGGARR